VIETHSNQTTRLFQTEKIGTPKMISTMKLLQKIILFNSFNDELSKSQN